MPIYNKKFESWFNFFIENPLKSWWKARRYFKFPKISIHFFSNPIHNCPYASFKWIGKILDIKSCDVQWKTKYEDICFESSPYIWVCLFKKFGFSINFNTYYKSEFGEKELLDIYYWEYLLNHIYNNLDLDKAYSVCYHDSRLYFMYNYDKNKPEPMKMQIPIVAYSLNNNGIKTLKSIVCKNEQNKTS